MQHYVGDLLRSCRRSSRHIHHGCSHSTSIGCLLCSSRHVYGSMCSGFADSLKYYCFTSNKVLMSKKIVFFNNDIARNINCSKRTEKFLRKSIVTIIIVR